MATIFRYAILKAIPDARRGERVNVGVLVLCPDNIDVRFAGLSKVRTLARGDWPTYADHVKALLVEAFYNSPTEQEFTSQCRLMTSTIKISDIASFSADTPAEYELRVSEILTSLVTIPSASKTQRSSRINTEIAAEFRRANALADHRFMDEAQATRYDPKVVRDFYVSPEEDLKADFALQNGVLHATATLDLRNTRVDLSRATLPALVLDKAVRNFGTETKKYGVYAAAHSTLSEYTPHIRILNDYADRIFNWSDRDDRIAYTRIIYTAMNRPDAYQLT
jgi:hypothetical protein